MAEDLIMAAPSSSQWQGSDVDVTTIEQQLAHLWKDLTHQAQLAGAVRTSMFNLVVYAEDEAAADRITDSLNQLSRRQPSRAVVLVGDRTNPRCALDASVCVVCQSAPDVPQPLCHEQIIVKARGRAADHLNSVVIPLLLPELPAYLWWPGQPPFGQRMFHRLLTVADELVVDSGQFKSPGDGFANLARLTTGRLAVHDSHWGRLTPWREIIAQFFDGPTWRPYARGIRSVRIEFGSGGDGRGTTAGTLLLLGWVASHLGWEPETTLDTLVTDSISLSVLDGERVIPIEIQVREAPDPAAGRLLGIELVSQPRGVPPARFTVHRTDDLQNVRVKMEIHGGLEITRVVPLAMKSEMQLLAEELELVDHDKLYDQVVEAASRMAGREIWVPV